MRKIRIGNDFKALASAVIGKVSKIDKKGIEEIIEKQENTNKQ